MALEVITGIKEAEKKAEDMIKEAEEMKKAALKKAEIRADEEYSRIISEADYEVAALIGKAEEEAQNEALPILQNGEKEIKLISNTPPDRIDKAVNFVIERIVNINGNCQDE